MTAWKPTNPGRLSSVFDILDTLREALQWVTDPDVRERAEALLLREGWCDDLEEMGARLMADEAAAERQRDEAHEAMERVKAGDTDLDRERCAEIVSMEARIAALRDALTDHRQYHIEARSACDVRQSKHFTAHGKMSDRISEVWNVHNHEIGWIHRTLDK